MNDRDMLHLVRRVVDDPEFRARIARDLDGSLAAEGYRFSGDELAAIRAFHGQVRDMSDAELAELARSRLVAASP